MTSISGTSGAPAATAQGSSGTAKPLGQADFLRLMTTQMQNQDPLKPMDSTGMLSQLAQFSTVQGIEGLNASMEAMASVMESDQTFRAAQLIGRDVYVETDRFQHAPGSALRGEVLADRPGSVQVDIVDASGNRVARRTVQATAAGAVAFQWDGKDDAGNPLPAGGYSVAASADIGASATRLGVRLAGRVENVSIEDYRLALNVPSLGSFALSQVRRLG